VRTSPEPKPHSVEPPRILHVIRSADPQTGGTIEVAKRFSEGLSGVAVSELVTLDPPDAAFIRQARLKIHALGRPGNAWRGDSLLARFGYSAQLAPWLRRRAGTYDFIIVHGIWDYVAVAAARTLPSGQAPYFVFPHGMLDAWFRRNNPLKHLRMQLFWLLFQGPLLSSARRVFFTTEQERVRAASQFIGYNNYESEIAYSGTGDVAGDGAAQVAGFRAHVPGLGDRPFLLFLGRIHPKKGCDLLIRAFGAIAARHPELALVMAGPDQVGWAAKLAEIATDAGVADRTFWPGMLVGDLKWGALRGAEAFVLPSHHENFGMAAAEALAAGTPVLLTHRVDLWRDVEASQSGFVADDTAPAIRELLERFLRLDPSMRAQMRSSARRCFEDKFDAAKCASVFLEKIRSAY